MSVEKIDVGLGPDLSFVNSMSSWNWNNISRFKNEIIVLIFGFNYELVCSDEVLMHAWLAWFSTFYLNWNKVYRQLQQTRN